jgi:hypothetical protein
MAEREPLKLKDAAEIEIVGLGQQRNVIFRTNDPNFDLFDGFVVYNPYEDKEFYLLVRVIGDEDRIWNDTDLACIEYFLKEDFGFDDYDVHCELIFGEDFARSIPTCWFFTISERKEEF